MTFYAEKRATADRLLTKFGRAVTLTDDEGTGSVDPTTGEWSAGATSSYAGTAVVFPAKEVRRVGLTEGSEYIAFLSAEALGAVPRTGWTLLVGAATFQILEVESLSPAGTDVMYTLMLKK